MRLFRTKYSDPEELLRNAPGPAPWYLRAYPPGLSDLVWRDSSEIDPDLGGMLLTNLNGEFVAIVGMYCYVLPIDQGNFVVWYQGYDPDSGGYRNKINFHFLKVEELEPIPDIQSALNQIKEKNEYFVANSESHTIFALRTDFEPGTHEVEYPDELKFTEELLLWGHSTMNSFQPRFGKNSSLCLFLLRPRTNSLEIIPQDWFNNSDELDFGYQWVTKVARDPQTSRIYGDGIRISSFVLDETLRNVARWISGRV